MAYLSALVQRVLNQIFYDNSTVITQSSTETNLSLIASLEYVQNYTYYYLQNNYLSINSPTFTGLMNGPNITLNNQLSTPTQSGACNFTGSPSIQNNKIEFDILGEIKMIVNELPPNYILCDGSGYLLSAYPDLFNLIGYKYGGSGAYFVVPNFNSYFPIGANASSSNNCALSNFSSGNGQSGAINNYSVSTKFGGGSIPQLPPLLTLMPNHAHSSTNFVHQHSVEFSTDTNVYILTDETAMFPITAQTSVFQPTFTSTTGVTVEDSGTDIQQTDPISGLNGVNVCPPYTCVKFAICYTF
jgi:microcystin-dependent protein